MTSDEKFLQNIIMELKEISKDVAKLEIKNAQCLEALAILKKDEKMFLAEHDENVKLHFENVDLKEQNARLRKALEKYANPETHSMDEDGEVWYGDYFDYKTARDALDGKE